MHFHISDGKDAVMKMNAENSNNLFINVEKKWFHIFYDYFQLKGEHTVEGNNSHLAEVEVNIL